MISQSTGTSDRNASSARPRSTSAFSGAISAPCVRCRAPSETYWLARCTNSSEPASCCQEAATIRVSASPAGPSSGRAAANAAVAAMTVRSAAASTISLTLLKCA